MNESFAHGGGIYGNLVAKSCPIGGGGGDDDNDDDDVEDDMASNNLVVDGPFDTGTFR